jgi:hypothetical protein
MAVAVINQLRDIEIIVMRDVADQPAFLVLNSPRVVNAPSLAGAPNLAGLTANLIRAFSTAGPSSIKFAQDYLHPGTLTAGKKRSAAEKAVRALIVKMQPLFAVAFRASNQADMIKIALGGPSTSFAYVIDHSHGINAPHILCPGGVRSGFFQAGVGTRIKALADTVTSDAKTPHEFVVYGKR